MSELVAKIDCDPRRYSRRRAELASQNLSRMTKTEFYALSASACGGPKPKSPRMACGVRQRRREGGVNVCVTGRLTSFCCRVSEADHYEYRLNAAGDVSVIQLTNVRAGVIYEQGRPRGFLSSSDPTPTSRSCGFQPPRRRLEQSDSGSATR